VIWGGFRRKNLYKKPSTRPNQEQRVKTRIF
jgi:hypothetical protein